MAEKRYQVFVSSTFRDLEKERWEAVKALMTMDCIVAGMESFPAVDEEQFKFIKEIIDACDYYLLILGGRYGTLAPDGIGYTEKEYDYALSKGIKVVALVREAPEFLPPEKRETDAALLDRFIKFREKVCADRLVSFWRDERDIQKDVALGMAKAMKKFPAIGWVRANSVASEELLREINTLRKENEELRRTPKSPESICMERLKRKYKISFMCMNKNYERIQEVFETTLFIIFKKSINEFNGGIEREECFQNIKAIILDIILNNREDLARINCFILDEQINDIINKFFLLKLIRLADGMEMNNFITVDTFYKLTEFGKRMAPEILFE